METHALISLKKEMKPKFQTMNRNYSLWVELSNERREHFEHERTPAQCAVCWKNIVSAYKDSRDALCNSRSDANVCSFYKELEAVLSDLLLTAAAPNDIHPGHSSVAHDRSGGPRKRQRLREHERTDTDIAFLLVEFIAMVGAERATIKRIEKMLVKGGMTASPLGIDIALKAQKPLRRRLKT